MIRKTHKARAQARKSLTVAVTVRLALHSVGTATVGSTLVRDLNSRAPMRGRCFIGTYAHQGTALAAFGDYGPANITANMSAGI